MRWYVKDEGTGTIYGPMTKDQALGTTDGWSKNSGVEGMVFSEELFSPKFDIIPRTDELIVELKEEIKHSGHLSGRGRIKELLQNSIDMLTILSREPDVSSDVKSLISDLRDLAGYSQGRPLVVSEICRRSIDMLTVLSREKV